MSTNVTDLTIEQAIALAVVSIRKSQDITPVAELAERAGITRQYLYRLANKRIEQEDLETEKAPTEVEAHSTTAEAAAITNESVARTA